MWRRLTTRGQAPSKRWGHSAVMDGDNMIVVGGRGTADYMDVHVLHLQALGAAKPQGSWSRLEVCGKVPSPRRRGAIALDTSGGSHRGNRLLIFGGYDGRFLNDMWTMQLPMFQTSAHELGVDPSWGAQHSAVAQSPPTAPPAPQTAGMHAPVASMMFPLPLPPAPFKTGPKSGDSKSPPVLPTRRSSVAGNDREESTARKPHPDFVHVTCVDGVLAFPDEVARKIMMAMPCHKMLPRAVVTSAVPFIREAPESALRIPGAKGSSPANWPGTLSMPGQAKVAESPAYRMGALASRKLWTHASAVEQILALGYNSARVIRGCHKLCAGNTKALFETTLNKLLDTVESCPENSPGDDDILAGLHSAYKGGDSSEQETSRTSRARSSADIENARQRILQLEAQWREMMDDLSDLMSCNISMELMDNPVVTPSGYLYEKNQIETWIKQQGNDPQTRRDLKRSQLVEVRALKEFGKKYRSRDILYS